MTNIDSSTIIYNYYDNVTASILDKWAKQYALAHNTSYDYAMVVTLLEVHKRGNK